MSSASWKIVCDGKWHAIECARRNLIHRINEIETINSGPIFVGISGDGGVGKSYLAKALAHGCADTIVFGTDGYILNRSERQKLGIGSGDHPSAINFDRMISDLHSIRSERPQTHLLDYDHSRGCPVEIDWRIPQKLRCVVVDGTASAYSPVRELLDLSIFLDANDRTRKHLRRIVDTGERGYTLNQFEKSWPLYLDVYRKYVAPCSATCDHICSVGIDRRLAGDLFGMCFCTA